MPEDTSGHMVATVYAIAEKGAKMILEDNAGDREHDGNEIKWTIFTSAEDQPIVCFSGL